MAGWSLKIGDHIEVLRDDGLPARVIFSKVPDNLRAQPTLSVTIASQKPGTRQATLSYLTPGLGWRADYVALFDEHDSKIDVQGWVTLSNSSGVTYSNAQTLLVAGSAGGAGWQWERTVQPTARGPTAPRWRRPEPKAAIASDWVTIICIRWPSAPRLPICRPSR